MTAIRSSFPLECDKSCFLVALEYNAKMIFILFAFRNRAGDIVVQIHNDLTKANLVPNMASAVQKLAFNVVGTPPDKLLLKICQPYSKFIVWRRISICSFKIIMESTSAYHL